MKLTDGRYHTIEYVGPAEIHFSRKSNGYNLPRNYDDMIKNYIKLGPRFMPISHLEKMVVSEYRPESLFYEGVDYTKKDRSYGDAPSGFVMSIEMYNDIYHYLTSRSELISTDRARNSFIDTKIDIYPLAINLVFSKRAISEQKLDLVEFITSALKESLLRIMSAMTIGREIKTFHTPHMNIKPPGLIDYCSDIDFTEKLMPSDILNMNKRITRMNRLELKWITHQATTFEMMTNSFKNHDEEFILESLARPVSSLSYDHNLSQPATFFGNRVIYDDHMPVNEVGSPAAILYNPSKFINYLFPEINIRRIDLDDDHGWSDHLLFSINLYLGTSCSDQSSIHSINIRNQVIPFEETF